MSDAETAPPAAAPVTMPPALIAGEQLKAFRPPFDWNVLPRYIAGGALVLMLFALAWAGKWEQAREFVLFAIGIVSALGGHIATRGGPQ